ncbi:hypothetical protein DICVIV_03919 [Dictyocaulus viviparus]|uniref:Uncharacterized protein n=1 Tax=Dictyocaulus viviparus TaxID=29172 RepID=A0A0D8Y1E3_DICVI|nr:hypothetical protein DICVIV_03919 [Dictyocaulus viviparus]
MYFDGMVLKSVLESFVDDIAEESSELLLERPRYAYAVVVIADEHEICEGNPLFRDKEQYDSEIQRALRELTESRDLLISPRQSILVDTPKHEVTNTSNITSLKEGITVDSFIDDIDRSAMLIKRSAAIQLNFVILVSIDESSA